MPRWSLDDICHPTYKEIKEQEERRKAYQQGRADREKEILEKVEHILHDTDLKYKRNWNNQQIITWLREVIYPIEKNC